MDKRSVFFVILVSISFLAINFIFSKLNPPPKTTPKHIAKTVDREIRQGKIPFVSITADKDSKTLLGTGIKVNNNTLTLAWSRSLPNQVYIGGEPHFLLTHDPLAETPAVYAPKQFKKFTIASLPQSGSYPVSVITFEGPENDPKIYAGEYVYGTLEFDDEVPVHNGLVFYQEKESFLPLAFYDAEGKVTIELQNLNILSSLVTASNPSYQSSEKEKYYVLENEYQQLVLSNVGGSVVGINLPFQSSKNTASVVKEIEFDRVLMKDNPQDSRFPNRPYFTYDSKEEKTSGALGGYYPLLRRSLSEKNAPLSPSYFAFNIVSDYPELAETAYTVKKFTKNEIVFEASSPQRTIRKTYRLRETTQAAPYCFDLEIDIDGDSRGLWLTSGVPEVELLSNTSTPLVQYRYFKKGGDLIEKVRLPKPKEVVKVSSVTPDWIVNSNGYFGIITDPLTDVGSGFRVSAIPGIITPTRLVLIDPQYRPYPATKYPGYQTTLPFPQKGGSFKFRIFAGPFEEGILKKIDRIYTDPKTGANPNYIACKTFHGWFAFIGKPFAKLLFLVMSFFYKITHSWAFSIILLTIFLRLLLYPLNAWSIKSMRRMQKLTPEVQALQKKFKKEPKKAQMEIMRLYREKKANPLTGCLPMIIQLPFLIAMFDLLKSSFQLRGASFIPGWINDLTAPDVLFSWSKPIFFIGKSFHLLPIILGVVMFFQQKFMSPGPKNPEEMSDQQRQQKAMGTMMTVIFTVMFYNFPSGLNLYWLSSMLLGILQQWMTNRWLDHKEKEAVKS